jgi:hypothetical protein
MTTIKKNNYSESVKPALPRLYYLDYTKIVTHIIEAKRINRELMIDVVLG